MNLHREHHFEREICEHLAANGWLYAEGDAAHYDREHALFLPDLLAWIEQTQQASWQALIKTHARIELEQKTGLYNSVAAMLSPEDLRAMLEEVAP